MVKVTLPDGKVLELQPGTTVSDVAGMIGPRLQKAAVAGKLNGQVVDVMRPIESDAKLEILTEKNPEALDVLRHSAAHMLATAVRQVRPDAGIGFGPSIENGFYYDFDVKTPFTPEDLESIEPQ